MTQHYYFENAQYVLKDDNGKVLDRLSEVSLLINKRTGELIAHGSLYAVHEQEIRYVNALIIAGEIENELIENMLMTISGKIPVDILNNCIDVSGYVKKFFLGRR
jgi:hypothetical protein